MVTLPEGDAGYTLFDRDSRDRSSSSRSDARRPSRVRHNEEMRINLTPVVMTCLVAGVALAASPPEPGDLVVSYDGDRVITTSQLAGAALAGASGEIVRLDFERGGQRHQAFIARGSLGARLKDVRHMPEPLH